jgi:hypothetical protein
MLLGLHPLNLPSHKGITYELPSATLFKNNPESCLKEILDKNYDGAIFRTDSSFSLNYFAVLLQIPVLFLALPGSIHKEDSWTPEKIEKHNTSPLFKAKMMGMNFSNLEISAVDEWITEEFGERPVEPTPACVIC